MNDLKEGLKDNEIQLLRTGMSDNANLLNEDELGELFGGYCSSGYCGSGYSNGQTGEKCGKNWCPGTYY